MIKKHKKLSLLKRFLSKVVSDFGMNWLEEKIQLLSKSDLPKDLHINFSLATRMVGKSKIPFTQDDINQFSEFHPRFNPNGWTADAAARIALIIAFDKDNEEEFIKAVVPLFETADVRELTTLYAGICILPYPEGIYNKAREASRTNISVAFNAMLYNNPYPGEYFDNLSWNQIIVKAVFNNQTLENVLSLEMRRNIDLAKICYDLLDERWAANRDVSVYIWKLLPGFIDESKEKYFYRVLEKGTLKHKFSAIAALIEDNSYTSQKILNANNELVKRYHIQNPTMTEIHSWEFI